MPAMPTTTTVIGIKTAVKIFFVRMAFSYLTGNSFKDTEFTVSSVYITVLLH